MVKLQQTDSIYRVYLLAVLFACVTCSLSRSTWSNGKLNSKNNHTGNAICLFQHTGAPQACLQVLAPITALSFLYSLLLLYTKPSYLHFFFNLVGEKSKFRSWLSVKWAIIASVGVRIYTSTAAPFTCSSQSDRIWFPRGINVHLISPSVFVIFSVLLVSYPFFQFLSFCLDYLIF